jgi:hypothetical protein
VIKILQAKKDKVANLDYRDLRDVVDYRDLFISCFSDTPGITSVNINGSRLPSSPFRLRRASKAWDFAFYATTPQAWRKEQN